ncbi:hypothetical protein VCR3J2_80163 [Vibrio coralliirubri]|nr:hypothetical protein VCR3J2_80163 [Vibrio coralliirubri]
MNAVVFWLLKTISNYEALLPISKGHSSIKQRIQKRTSSDVEIEFD